MPVKDFESHKLHAQLELNNDNAWRGGILAETVRGGNHNGGGCDYFEISDKGLF